MQMSNKSKIAFVTDSGADLSAQLLGGREIEILTMPLTTSSGEELSADDNIGIINIYDRLRRGESIKTAQVPLADYIACFERHAAANEAVIYTCLSSGLTGSFATAKMAAALVREQYPEAVLEIIDSASATAGFGNGVLSAYDYAQSGASLCEIVRHIYDAFDRTRHFFSVPTLQYLVRGGRVSALKGAMGDCLSIKPFLDIDPSGALYERERVRGEKKMLSRLTDELVRAVDANRDHHVYVLHGDDIDTVNEILFRAAKKVDVSNVSVNLLGAVIGAHTGPGMIAVVYEDEQYSRGISRCFPSCSPISSCALCQASCRLA